MWTGCNEEIGKLCNKAFGVDWTESAHRKKTQNYLKGYNDAKSELRNSDQQLQNLINENKRLKHGIAKELKRVQTDFGDCHYGIEYKPKITATS